MSPPLERRASLSLRLLPAVCALLWCVQIYAFHWGVITPDTVSQYSQALSGRYQDWHPPIMAWIWRQLNQLWPGSAPLLVLNCALYWLGFGLLVHVAARRNMRWAAIAFLLIGAFPIAFGQMGAILKDSLLTGCLIASVGIAALPLSTRRPVPWPLKALGATALIVAAASRFNGVFAAAPLLLLLFRPAEWEGRWQRAAAGTFVAALVLAGSSLIVNRLLLQPERTHPIISLINFDLAGISLGSGRNRYPEYARPEPALLKACYSPAMFNPHYDPACDLIEDRLDSEIEAHGGERGEVWIAGILHEPLAYTVHRLKHFNANQRWLAATVPDDAVYSMSEPNHLGLRFAPNGLTDLVCGAAQIIARSPLGRPATWLGVAAAMLIAGANPGARAIATAVAASSLLYGFAYLGVSVAPDLRYNLWTMVGAMLAVPFGFATWSTGDRSARRFVWAFLPLALILLGELAALAYR